MATIPRSSLRSMRTHRQPPLNFPIPLERPYPHARISPPPSAPNSFGFSPQVPNQPQKTATELMISELQENGIRFPLSRASSRERAGVRALWLRHGRTKPLRLGSGWNETERIRSKMERCLVPSVAFPLLSLLRVRRREPERGGSICHEQTTQAWNETERFRSKTERAIPSFNAPSKTADSQILAPQALLNPVKVSKSFKMIWPLNLSIPLHDIRGERIPFGALKAKNFKGKTPANHFVLKLFCDHFLKVVKPCHLNQAYMPPQKPKNFRLHEGLYRLVKVCEAFPEFSRASSLNPAFPRAAPPRVGRVPSRGVPAFSSFHREPQRGSIAQPSGCEGRATLGQPNTNSANPESGCIQVSILILVKERGGITQRNSSPEIQPVKAE
jgi:hypothetical protein